MFHRVDMHKMLMDDALSGEGEGIPVKLIVDHRCSALDAENGLITFTNGTTAQHEVIIGADGVGVCVLQPKLRSSADRCSLLFEHLSVSKLTRSHQHQPVSMQMLQPQMFTG